MPQFPMAAVMSTTHPVASNRSVFSLGSADTGRNISLLETCLEKHEKLDMHAKYKAYP